MSEKSVGVILVVVLVLGSFAIGFGPELMRKLETKRVLREGAPATAVITALEDTGNRANDNPEVIVSLEVSPEGAPSFSASVTTYLGAVELQSYAIGAEIAVRYDPADPSVVVLSGPPQPPASPAAQQAPAQQAPAQQAPGEPSAPAPE
ncbi:hypothetical protein G6O69_14345 [Pseudenhygromyxa sp. WMMC2535]|uniref:DUF3592 domain-containing protein n=1 Tax=Pseudenhygromyxa sp. WMMC2535 TaxID=2712867 RepID=UPI00155575DA|nr:DUF3592 domain-containing protein [Pseudenhygromyxa sp. WMMC2535]NVB39019.1 hypothetical protein [Pseudenhygromyxa sp. WMMC2535]